ncbi:bestrophin family protein [Hymenobacter coalescens]
MFSLLFQTLKMYVASYLPPVPVQLPTILGSFISLLLAFNMNQSYDRWWEARKVWGAIVNDSRSLVLQLRQFIDPNQLPGGAAGTLLRRLGHRQIAWCYSLGNSLRGLDALAGLDKLVSPDELASLADQRNKPLAMLQLHTEDLNTLAREGAINSYQQVQLDATLVRLCEAMGQAERIKSTVFPVTYRLFIHLFIYLFLIILSLGLVEEVGLLEIPALTVVASVFFLLEKTARYLQDPFSNKPTDTPVSAIARTIEINVRQLLREPQVPQPHQPEAFYLM